MTAVLGGIWQRATLACLLVVVGLLASPTAAQEPARGDDGLFVTVPNPITDQSIQQIRLKIKDAAERQRRVLRVIVFDFTPNGLPAGSTSFGICSDLADYIRALSFGQITGNRPRTVAFLQNEVSGHTVLPILACSEIVMSAEKDPTTRRSKAKLGNVTRDIEGTLSKAAESAYQSAAERWASPDLILRMTDPTLPIRKVDTVQGVRFWSLDRIEARKKAKERITVHSTIPAGLEPGVAMFDTEKCREFGICQATFNSRAELAQGLKLPPSAIREDWLVGKTLVPWRIDVTGQLDRGRLDSLRRRISSALAKNANLLIFHLEAEGRDTAFVASVANEIRELRSETGKTPIRTIAYLPPGQVLGASSFLALACDEIVVGKDSVLADFNFLKNEGAEALKVLQEMLVPLAKDQGYPPSLFQAALNRKAVLYQVRDRTDPVIETFLSEKEFQTDLHSPNPKWVEVTRITPVEGELLKIDSEMALTARVALGPYVDSLDQLYQRYQLTNDQVRVSRDDLLDRVAEFFRDPIVNFVLVMLGIMGLILEVKMPGTTLPGTVSAICFVLFFWAHSFVGEFTMLAVMLFLLGIIMIGVEIFLIPGFGFTGLAGVLLMITSLVLVTLESVPRSGNDWARVGTTVTTFGVSVVAAIVGAFIFAYFLPSIPYFNRLVLRPPEESEDEHGESERVGSTPTPTHLLGAIGFAVTPLRPAGKIQVDQEFLDVIAEGDYIQPGGRVRIVEIEGNRIVVQEVY